MSNILYIVVPCYNEQEVLPETSKRLREKVQTLRQSGKIDADSRILFVNDGSKDATWEMVQKLHEENPVFSGVNLSRNRGKLSESALMATNTRSLALFRSKMDCLFVSRTERKSP